jgi:hypothetical protein
MSGYVLGTTKKIFFLVRNMERLSSLNVSFGTHDIGTLTATKAVFWCFADCAPQYNLSN